MQARRLLPAILALLLLLLPTTGGKAVPASAAASAAGGANPPSAGGAAGAGSDAPAPSMDDLHQLLQQALTVHEIDQEIAQLSAQSDGLKQQIAQVAGKMADQQAQADAERERAAEVLRAYYMGERLPAWIYLLQARSLSDAWIIWGYVSRIFANDHLILQQYAKSAADLQQQQQALEEARGQLQDIQAQFAAKRADMLAKQRQLDAELAQRKDAAKVRSQMDALVQQWDSEGLPAFHTYFNALAQAMNHMQDYLKEHGDALVMSSLTDYTLTMKAKDLNEFLAGKNPILKHVTIAFTKGGMTVTGRQDNMVLTVTGHVVIDKQPRNEIRYVIDSMDFNGYALPGSAIAALGKQYDLSFSPQDMASFVRADSVEMQEGALVIRLSLNLGG